MNEAQEKTEAAMALAVEHMMVMAETAIPAAVSDERGPVVTGNATSVLIQMVVTHMVEKTGDRDAVLSGLSLGVAFTLNDLGVSGVCDFYNHAHEVGHMVESGALSNGEVRVSRGARAPAAGSA